MCCLPLSPLGEVYHWRGLPLERFTIGEVYHWRGLPSCLEVVKNHFLFWDMCLHGFFFSGVCLCFHLDITLSSWYNCFHNDFKGTKTVVLCGCEFASCL